MLFGIIFFLLFFSVPFFHVVGDFVWKEKFTSVFWYIFIHSHSWCFSVLYRWYVFFNQIIFDGWDLEDTWMFQHLLNLFVWETFTESDANKNVCACMCVCVCVYWDDKKNTLLVFSTCCKVLKMHRKNSIGIQIFTFMRCQKLYTRPSQLLSKIILPLTQLIQITIYKKPQKTWSVQ